MNNSLMILLMSTISIGFVHSLAPDHWMPFVAISKAKKWSKARLLWVTFICGLGHVGTSIIFSAIGILLGFSLSKLKHIEGHRGEIALWLLIGFGVAYMLWGLKKGREHIHHHHHEPIEQLRKKTVTLWTLFAIFVLGPCEPLVPLVFLGYNYGYAGVILISVVFSVVTIFMMLAQSYLGYLGIELIKHDILDRYSHAFAGLVIALTGLFVLAAGI